MRLAFAYLAVCALAALGIWKTCAADPIVDLEEVTRPARESLTEKPVAPSVADEVAEVLFREGVQAAVPAVGSEEKDAIKWSDRPRKKINLAWYFATNDGNVTIEDLLRDPTLNPLDTVIPEEIWEPAQAQIELINEKIRRVDKLAGDTSDTEMTALIERGLARKIKPRPITQNGVTLRGFLASDLTIGGETAYASRMVGNEGYVFLLDELPGTKEAVAVREYLAFEIAGQATSFFQQHAALTPVLALEILDRTLARLRTGGK